MRTYVVADLHGRFDLLQKVLDRIEADAGDRPARFICLGDFIDRGPQSKEIMDCFMAGPTLPNWEWIILQGNHEEMMLDALAHPQVMRHWRKYGGNDTLKSLGIKPGNNPNWCANLVPHEYRAFLQSLPHEFQDEHRIYVHAGVPFDKETNMVPKNTKQWMLYREKGADEYPDAEYHDGLGVHVSGKHVVHGHVQDHCHPLIREGRTNLDSWAYFTGKASVGVFDDKHPGGPVEIIYVYDKPDKDYLKFLNELERGY